MSTHYHLNKLKTYNIIVLGENMRNIIINNKEYTLQEDPFKAFEESLVKDTITDYFMPFDYIFGDFSYGKIRFKGLPHGPCHPWLSSYEWTPACVPRKGA